MTAPSIINRNLTVSIIQQAARPTLISAAEAARRTEAITNMHAPIEQQRTAEASLRAYDACVGKINAATDKTSKNTAGYVLCEGMMLESEIKKLEDAGFFVEASAAQSAVSWGRTAESRKEEAQRRHDQNEQSRINSDRSFKHPIAYPILKTFGIW